MRSMTLILSASVRNTQNLPVSKRPVLGFQDAKRSQKYLTKLTYSLTPRETTMFRASRSGALDGAAARNIVLSHNCLPVRIVDLWLCLSQPPNHQSAFLCIALRLGRYFRAKAVRYIPDFKVNSFLSTRLQNVLVLCIGKASRLTSHHGTIRTKSRNWSST
jgi:hypothetical protein